MAFSGWALLAVAGVFALSAAKAPAPSATAHIHIVKSKHRLEVIDQEKVVRTFGVSIGPGGAGVKHREGDKVTPVGRYHVVSHVPSTYHVFFRLDYPNAEDKARFARMKAAGELPKDATIGGDIGIHGAPPQAEWKTTHKEVDWTLGCIPLDDSEVDELATLVRDGASVDISD